MLEGFVLMVVGMSVVFVFLGILVGAVNLSAFFFTRLENKISEVSGTTLKPAESVKDENIEIAVALAAIRARDGLII